MLLGDSVISWKTKKQDVVSRLSPEFEYRSMASACSELIWIVGLLKNLLVDVPFQVSLFCNNQAAMHIAHNLVYHDE